MAGDRTERRLKTYVLRSCGLYLLVRGGLARFVPSDGKPRPAAPTDSVLAHTHVHFVEPWVEVPEGETLPDAVTAARDGGDGWDAPEWAEG